ncbi:hypothetical protein AB0L59_17555 [Streptomyces sp. NPDC052109]|uniref:hypothetical protein n=1 Tax=Streptomyces sp. NPDC052109 TaxID=3155527 RepID=UPI00343C0C7C
MNVLVCAARGRRLSEPLRLLPGLPERPAYSGLKNPDGSRHAPSTVPRGASAVDPAPSGAPFVPHPDPERMGYAIPGVCLGDADGRSLMPAGPHDTWVVHPEDTRDFLASNDACRETGCCGASGTHGPNLVCPGCRAEVATLFADCSGPYETHLLPAAVRAVPA